MSVVKPHIVGLLVRLPQENKAHHAVSRSGENPATSARLSFCPKEDTGPTEGTLPSPQGSFLTHQPGPICPLGFLSPSLHSDESPRHFWLVHPCGKGTVTVLFSSLSPELPQTNPQCFQNSSPPVKGLLSLADFSQQRSPSANNALTL